MAIVFMMNEEIARGMVCFFHQKKHSYSITVVFGYLYALTYELILTKKWSELHLGAFLQTQLVTLMITTTMLSAHKLYIHIVLQLKYEHIHRAFNVDRKMYCALHVHTYPNETDYNLRASLHKVT
jgi:hypothetical protein